MVSCLRPHPPLDLIASDARASVLGDVRSHSWSATACLGAGMCLDVNCIDKCACTARALHLELLQHCLQCFPGLHSSTEIQYSGHLALEIMPLK